MEILLVEDDTDLQKVLAQYLELSGFTVYRATMVNTDWNSSGNTIAISASWM